MLDKIEKRLLGLQMQKEQGRMLEQLSDAYQDQLMNDYLKAIFTAQKKKKTSMKGC